MFGNYLKQFLRGIKNLVVGTRSTQYRLAKIEHLLELFRNEYKFAPRTVFMVSEKIGITKIETGQKLYIDRNDVSLAPHLVLDGRWEPNVTSWLLKNYNCSSTFLDIGANFGYFSILLGSVANFNAGGKIYAIEPNPYMADLIEKSVSINGFGDRVKVLKIAVGDVRRKLPLYESSDKHFGSTTLRDAHNSTFTKNAISVEVDTLDSIVERENIRNIGLIKMDIEGFEEKAFRGMQNLIANNKSIKIISEFSPHLYEKPVLYFTKIIETFSFVAVLGESGNEIPVDRYEQVVAYSLGGHCDLVMYNAK